MWVFSMELASCHPSGAQNFKMAPRFLENLCIPAVSYIPNVADLKGQNITEIHFRHYTCSVIAITLKEMCLCCEKRSCLCYKLHSRLLQKHTVKLKPSAAAIVLRNLEETVLAIICSWAGSSSGLA